MKISLVDLLQSTGAIKAALEAETGSGVYQPETHEMRYKNIGAKSLDPNAPMEIGYVTDAIIKKANLKPVTDPISFTGHPAEPTEGGLFSPEIFGRTPEEKDRQFAYIDLVEKFFHPYVYEILDDLMPKRFKKCASGQGSWALDENGYLVELKEGDKGYEKRNAGIAWLVSIYPKMKYPTSNSLIRQDKLKLLKDFGTDNVLISKWLVIPIKYRDIDKNTSTYKLPVLNDSYNKIIRNANSLRDSVFNYFDYAVRFNIQNELVNIRKYGQSLLEKKTGFFHKFILGKSVDRGSRDVISVPSFRGCQKPSQQPIDMFHTGVPLAKCLIIGFDFIMRYCLQFFANQFQGVTEWPRYVYKNGQVSIKDVVQIDDQVAVFNNRYITKKINRFKNSHGTRFEKITFKAKNGEELVLHFSGLPGKMSRSSGIAERPMTWTDLFYMAAEATLTDKYVYITRYPIEGYNSIFPSLVEPLSTIDTVPMTINGQYYPRYPKIDLSAATDKISNLFIDTVTMCDAACDIMGADFDGDTVSLKLCFSIEANAEARQIAESTKNFIGQDGELIRVVGKETYLTFYNMTRNAPKGRPLSDEKKDRLLKLNRDNLTVRDITKLFGYSTNSSGDRKAAFDIRDPEYNLRDTLTLKAGEYINQKPIETTVGKVLFNKLFIEGTDLTKIVPNSYYNEEVTASKMKKLSRMVSDGCLQGLYKCVPTVSDYVKNMEFWGLSLVAVIAPSYSMETIMPNQQLEKKKQELLSKADPHNLMDLASVEDELTAEAKRLLKDSPGMYMFDSGARGSFENDFKNMQISVGLVQDPISGTYNFMKSSYMQGISKEDIPAASNSVINAEFPKAIGTAQGGYMTKQFYAVFQSLTLADPGTDCGATNGLKITLTKDNLTDYIDQYIIDGSKLVLITPNLDSKYMNHEIQVRSPMYCCHPTQTCNMCAGERYYKLGIRNYGLGTNRLSGKLQNASLKLRHSLRIKVNEVNPYKYLK